MSYKHDPNLTANARALRKHMTREELRLWYNYLRNCPVRFLRQKVIDGYIVDFYCAQARLVVELDGSQHYEDEAASYDRARTEKLAERGLMVLRVPNNEVNNNFRGVCEHIMSVVEERVGALDEGE